MANDEWYTPARYLEMAREVMGGIDLDPASSDRAQETVQAGRYYTAKSSGLTPVALWQGRVWLNPPYSRGLVDIFVARLLDGWRTGAVSQFVCLVNAATDTAWCQSLLSEPGVTACFTRGRIAFTDPDTGKPVKGNQRGQIFFYGGEWTNYFVSRFSELGTCLRSPDR